MPSQSLFHQVLQGELAGMATRASATQGHDHSSTVHVDEFDATAIEGEAGGDVLAEDGHHLLHTLDVSHAGGGLDFDHGLFDGAELVVALRGACSGCHSSQLTLKNLVEKTLREQVDPAINVVEA